MFTERPSILFVVLLADTFPLCSRYWLDFFNKVKQFFYFVIVEVMTFMMGWVEGLIFSYNFCPPVFFIGCWYHFGHWDCSWVDVFVGLGSVLQVLYPAQQMCEPVNLVDCIWIHYSDSFDVPHNSYVHCGMSAMSLVSYERGNNCLLLWGSVSV